MKAYSRIGGIDQFNLNLRTSWRWVFSALSPLLVEYEVVWAEEPGLDFFFFRRETFLVPPRIRTPDRSLYRPRYPSSFLGSDLRPKG